METYRVGLREIAEQDVLIEADSMADAIMAVREGEGDYVGTPRYVETLDPETWSVILEKE